jgi:hypothetical protein
MRNLAIDSRQLSAVQGFLASLRPREELAYRLALAGMFAECRDSEWKQRTDELLAELAPGVESMAWYLKRARGVETTLQTIIKSWS